MKKSIFVSIIFLFGVILCNIDAKSFKINEDKKTESKAEIKFDTLSYNVGSFLSSSPKVSCSFAFTNIGSDPLIIHQALPSCGCTVANYPKKPISPGERGEIKVTYNGKGRNPGHFKKSITVHTNGVVEVTRLYIEGEME